LVIFISLLNETLYLRVALHLNPETDSMTVLQLLTISPAEKILYDLFASAEIPFRVRL